MAFVFALLYPWNINSRCTIMHGQKLILPIYELLATVSFKGTGLNLRCSYFNVYAPVYVDGEQLSWHSCDYSDEI